MKFQPINVRHDGIRVEMGRRFAYYHLKGFEKKECSIRHTSGIFTKFNRRISFEYEINVSFVILTASPSFASSLFKLYAYVTRIIRDDRVSLSREFICVVKSSNELFHNICVLKFLLRWNMV